MTIEAKNKLWALWQELGDFGTIYQNDEFHFTFIANNEEIRHFTNAIFDGQELSDILEEGSAYDD